MSLYIPPKFNCKNRDDALALIRAWPFATLITTTGGEPHITHLPLRCLEDGLLTGHMARANPHWQAFAAGDTTAVFHGPHAYISPLWYDDPAVNVPTWNFAVVHVHGQPVLIDDAAAKLAIVDATSAVFESADAPWRRQVQGAKLDAMLDHIIAFQMPLTRLDSQFKLNQNKTPADRMKVIAHLQASPHPDLAAVASLMQQIGDGT